VTEFLQPTLYVWIRVVQNVNGDNQMQQTPRERAFLQQFEQFIDQRDAG
jgi:hypothetical protein